MRPSLAPLHIRLPMSESQGARRLPEHGNALHSGMDDSGIEDPRYHRLGEADKEASEV